MSLLVLVAFQANSPKPAQGKALDLCWVLGVLLVYSVMQHSSQPEAYSVGVLLVALQGLTYAFPAAGVYAYFLRGV